MTPDQDLSREQLLQELKALRQEIEDLKSDEKRLQPLVSNQNQGQLETAAARYRGLFYTMVSGVAIYQAVDEGRDFVFKDINPAGERIGCIQKNDVIGRSVSEIFPSVHTTGVYRLFQDVWRTGQAQHCAPHLYHDERLNVWTKDSILKLPSGELVQIHDDVTDSVNINRRLEESEQKYRTLVESAAEEICVINNQGVFLFVNTRIAEYFSLAPEAMINKTLWDFFPPLIADGKVAIVRKVLETGKGRTDSVPSEIDGQQQWYEATTVPLEREGERWLSVMVIARNVTKLKKAQEALERYREEMSRAERLANAGTLSAMVAHELSQPLTVMRLSMQNALAATPEKDDSLTIRENLEEGLKEMDHVVALVNRFRSFAKATLDKQAGNANLATVIQKTLRLLDVGCRRARVSISLEQVEELPPVALAEKDIEQLVFILIENCLQAADGQTDHQLMIQGHATEGTIELRFSDDCGGIPTEHLDQIFEPFFTSKPRDVSTGLGLCIAQRIVAEAHGHITVDNRPGQGVTFCITLPQHR